MRPDTTPVPLPANLPAHAQDDHTASPTSSQSQSSGQSPVHRTIAGRRRPSVNRRSSYNSTADGHSPVHRKKNRDRDLGSGMNAHSSHRRRRSSDLDDQFDGEDGAGRRHHGGDERMTVRRREANRLAAQRFRSRKKGYQDNLEERIKILEQEKEVLFRQMDGSLHRAHASHSRSNNNGHASRHMNDDAADDRRWSGGSSSIPRSSMRTSGSSRRSSSPDRRDTTVDVDVRIAALESANRRLQEDVRGTQDESEQLREELRRWRVWSRDSQNRNRDRDDPRRNPSDIDGHPHPDQVSLHQHSGHLARSPSSYTTPNLMPRPSFAEIGRKESYGPLPSSVVDGKPPGPGPRSGHQLQLPPLLLPPIRNAFPPDTTALPSPTFSTSHRNFGPPHLDIPG